MTVRDFRDESLAARRSSARPRHVRLEPGLVDEDQTLRVETELLDLPGRPLRGDVGPILLRRVQRLFFSVSPS
jgi:hypothetical protein